MLSNTALLFLVLFFGALAGAIIHPIWPLAAYLIDYYQHPPLRWWGRQLPDGIRWALLASMTLLVSCLLHGKMPLGRDTIRHPQIKCLLAYCLIALLVTPFAVSVERSIHYLTMLWQLTLLVLVMVVALDRPKYWRLVAVLLAIGGLTWGLDAWIDPSRQAGRLQAIGGPDSRNDNSAAVHLLATLPFIAVMGFYGKLPEKLLAIVSFPFVLNTIILCNSRGATVAMGAMGLAGFLLTRGRVRMGMGVIGLSGIAVTVFLADPQFIERQMTIFVGERDGSTQGRLDSWAGAVELMVDYPLGAGGGGFDILSPVYIPEVVARYDGAERGVHNTYLWIGSDWGVAGLVAFLGYLSFTFTGVQRARKACRDDRRLEMEGLAVQASMVGVCVGAIFISRSYGEILYWVPALGTAYINIVQERAEAFALSSRPATPTGETSPMPAPVAAPVLQPWTRRS